MTNEIQPETNEVIAAIKADALQDRIAELKQAFDEEMNKIPFDGKPIAELFDKDGNLTIKAPFAMSDHALGDIVGFTEEEVKAFREEHDIPDQFGRQHQYSVKLFRTLEILAKAYESEKGRVNMYKDLSDFYKGLYHGSQSLHDESLSRNKQKIEDLKVEHNKERRVLVGWLYAVSSVFVISVLLKMFCE